MKHHEQHARLAFNEQRALDDLQRLHREIQRARSDRERAETDFDQFVRGFRSGVPASAPAAHREPEISPAEPRIPMADTPQTRETVPAVSAAETPVAATANPAAERPPRRGARRFVVPITVAAMIVGVFAARSRKASPPPEESPLPNVVSSPAAAPPPPSPAATAQTSRPATPAKASGVTIELVTHRPVWVRVFLDGRRAIERELPAGQRLPLRADRTIVVRAGDAGGVSVVVNGRDQGVLGEDGAVATRAFAAESR